MLCVVVVGPTVSEAQEQVVRGSETGDMLEFRLDLFSFTEIEEIRGLHALASVPVIFSLRSRAQGGAYRFAEAVRLQTIKELGTLHPEYVDLEHDIADGFVRELTALFPQIKIITSYHDFNATPEDLETLFAKMQNPFAALYKIATMAQTTNDALRLLHFVQQRKEKVCAFCMGEKGEVTRILGPVYGSALTYCVIDRSQRCAPGQLEAATLIEVYHYHKLSPCTKVLGLIGDPVSQSPGHLTHNQVIRALGLDAVYVKMTVAPEELETFLFMARQLGILGLSVTMPLKEAAASFTHSFYPGAQEIGAVNTLRLDEKTVAGRNTDGCGALEALEETTAIAGKKMVIIGAGGTAKAIASAALQRGAQVVVVNRSAERARRLAAAAGCSWVTLEAFPKVAAEGYDVIVNATPIGDEEHPCLPNLLQGKVAMDVVYKPLETPFLREAKRRGGRVVHGLEMFARQAAKQFSFWFGDKCNEKRVLEILMGVLAAK